MMERSLGAWMCALLAAFPIVNAAESYPQKRSFEARGKHHHNVTSPYLNSTTTLSSMAPIISSNITSSFDGLNPVLPTTAEATTSSDLCSGSITYYNSIPPTVYVTVTEGFTVTVTASNASLPPSQIITPPPYCVATIVPEVASGSSNPCVAGVCFPGSASASSVSNDFPPPLTIVTLSGNSANHPAGISTKGPAPSETPAEVTTGSAFTSTVLVTKKTPVPVVAPPSTSPPVFQISPPSQVPTTTRQNAGGGGGGGGGGSIPAGPANGNPTTSINAGSIPGGSGSTPAVGGSGSKSTSDTFVVAAAPTTTKIGNIIASAINEPFTPASAGTSAGGKVPGTVPVAPATITLDQVPVVILPSSVVIGGQVLSLPPSGASYTTAIVNGQTFTVENSQIIAPGTTYAINAAKQQQGEVTPLPSAVTADGLTFTVGQTDAVISGKTYAIGQGARPTTVVIGGKTLSIGSKGVGLASTTVAPEPIYEPVTVGSLTFSVDHSEAIISGTTYKIGSGAPTETVVVGGKTLSLGPSGVGMASTTIAPESTSAPGYQGSAASLSMDALGFLGILLVLGHALF